MSDKPDVPSQPPTLFGLAARIYDAAHAKGGSTVAIATIVDMVRQDRERIRAETLAPFYDLVEWDSEENLEDDHAERWIKLGDKLRSLLPPKGAPDA